MSILILGLALFLGVHSVSIVARPWRDATAARIGEGPWKGLYSLVSLAGFALIVFGYGLARQQPVLVYAPPAGLRHLALLMMLPVFPLLIAAYLPGRLQRMAKHPMLLAVKLWALAHLLANGMLADLLLFGSFLVWAGLDRMAAGRRPAPSNPAAGGQGAARLQLRAGSGWVNDGIALVVGLLIYVAFLRGTHAWLFGVSPI